MAQRAKTEATKVAFPRSRTFGTAAVSSARYQFAWMWSRESILRLALSLILAIALWLYVVDKQDPTQAYDYPYPLTVNAQNVKTGLRITNDLPVVRVRIQTSQNTPIATASFHTFIDLSKYGAGRYYVPVGVVPDPGIKVIQTTPSRIWVVLDTFEENHVPVRWRLLGGPAAGYAVGNITANPSTVLVSGPSEFVSQVTQAVAYVSLHDARSTINNMVKLSLENSQGKILPTRLLSIDQSEVQVTVPITSLTSFKALPIVASIRGTPQPGLGVVAVMAKPSEITAYGPPSTLRHLSAVSTSAIWVSGRRAGSVSTRVKLHLPKGVSSADSWAVVSVQVQPVEESGSVQIAISPQNVPPRMTAHIQPAGVLVTVLGSQKAMQTVGHVSASVDLSGLHAGTHQLQPHVSVPTGLRIGAMNPSMVTVVLSNTNGR